MKKVLSALALMALVVVGLLLPAPASAAGAAWYVANQESSFSHQVATLKGDNTSVETTEAFDGYDVVDGKVIFQFKLEGDAKCAAGAPRVFVTTEDGTANSWDQNIGDNAQCGTTDAEGWAEVTMNITGDNVTALGVVYDNGAGGQVQARVAVPTGASAFATVAFDAADVEPSPTPTPSATESASPTPTPSASESASPTASATPSESASATPPAGDGPVVVEVETPAVGEVTCEELTVYTEQVEGVEWSFGEQTDTTIVVIAKTAEGYVFADGKTQLTWTLTYVLPTGCDATPAPGTTPTGGSGGSVGSGTDGGGLPVTGAKVLTVAGVGGLLVAVGGLLLVGLRRKRNAMAHGDNDATLEMRTSTI